MTQGTNQDITLDNNQPENEKENEKKSQKHPKKTAAKDSHKTEPVTSDVESPSSAPEKTEQTTDTETEAPKEESQEEQIEELSKEVDSYRDKLLRQVAEFENYKKQKDREIANIRKFANEGLILDLLPVLDDVERVLQNADKFLEESPDAKAYVDGVKLIHQNLLKAFELKGVQRLNALGEKFDVNLHEALSQIEKEGVQSDTIVEEYVPGYKMNDRVIRHAKVVVAK